MCYIIIIIIFQGRADYMKQGIEYDKQAWITLFDKEYKDNQYLYHYTDILKAIKILNTDSLK